MLFNLFFSTNFDKVAGELGIPQWRNYYTTSQLEEIKKYSKDVLNESPEQGALRAFIQLVLQNEKIKLPERLESALSMRTKMKIWHVDKKVNLDFFQNYNRIMDELLNEYAGEKYLSEFYKTLREPFGLPYPILHDHLDLFSKMWVYKGVRNNKKAGDCAEDFFYNHIVANRKDYLKFFPPDVHWEILEQIRDGLNRQGLS